MDFLDGMMEIVQEMEQPMHPLCTEDISVRYPYVLGIALLLARADKAFSKTGRLWFADFARSMGLPEEHVRKIGAEAETADPVIVHKIIPSLADPKISRCFLVDLRRASTADGHQSEAKTKMIAGFERLLKVAPQKESETAPHSNKIEPEAAKVSSFRCLNIKKCGNRIQYSVGSEYCHRGCRDKTIA